jgi:hypothetical protein
MDLRVTPKWWLEPAGRRRDIGAFREDLSMNAINGPAPAKVQVLMKRLLRHDAVVGVRQLTALLRGKDPEAAVASGDSPALASQTAVAGQ